MIQKHIHPSKIVTLSDYPLHNEQILKIYFYTATKTTLPPVPVIHKSAGIPEPLKEYIKQNPKVEYFLLDGSHKTTAATLCHKKINAIILETNKDFAKAKQLAKKGEFFGWHKIENSMKEAINELTQHHTKSKNILTIEEKTKLLVKNKNIPKYMIDFYKKLTN